MMVPNGESSPRTRTAYFGNVASRCLNIILTKQRREIKIENFQNLLWQSTSRHWEITLRFLELMSC